MGTFTTELRDHIMFLRFGAPGAHNVMRDDWFADFEGALRDASTNPLVRSIHLSAEGRSFSSGGDLQAFLCDPFPQGVMNSALARCLAYLETFEKPIVAVVHGAAVGGGTTLLLHCDFVYAEPSTTFQLPFTRLGIVPELGSTWLLSHHAGQRLATELLLLGRPFDAATAQKAGIVSDTLARPELEQRAEDTARALAALPPSSVRATKRLMKKAQGERLATAWRDECRALETCLAGDEAREACRAVLERRQPDFSQFI